MSELPYSDLAQWATHHLENRPPRAKSLVMTLFGDVIRPHGGKLWLGSLIQLLAPFGISDRLVRTSVYRLAEEGWLSAQREGRRSQYTLRPEASQRFEHAYQRIYTPTYLAWDGQWTLIFSMPSLMMNSKQRADLRKELLWEGFCALSPTAFLHPNPDHTILDYILQATQAQSQVYVGKLEPSQLPQTRPLSQLIQDSWDLAQVASGYGQFIQRFAPALAMLDAGHDYNDELAFVIRTLLIHEFRRIQLHDPQLPIELLPAGWAGKQAYELCRDVYRQVCGKAERYILSTLRAEDEQAPEAAAYFYERFDGLPVPSESQARA